MRATKAALRRWTIVAAALATLLGCSTPTFSVTPAIGQVRVSGDYVAEQIGAPFDFADDSFDEMGLDDPEVGATLEARLAFDRSDLSLSVLDASFEGSGVVTSVFSDGFFTDPRPVRSELDVTSVRASYTWNAAELGPFVFGLGGGLVYSDVQIEARPVRGSPTRPGRTSFRGTLPLVGARIAVHGEQREAFLEANALVGGGDGDTTDYLDAALGMLFEVHSLADVVLAIRYQAVSAEGNEAGSFPAFVYDSETDLELLGVFLGARVSF